MSSPSIEYLSSIEPMLGPEGRDLPDPAALAALREASSAAIAQGQADALQRHLRSLPKESGVHVARAYLDALLALARSDGAKDADTSFHSAAEKLNQNESWAVLAPIALEWLEGTQDVTAARYLVRAWKNAGTAVVPESALRRAHEIFSDDHEIAWCLGSALEESGTTREGRRLLASALKPFAVERDVARLEEGVLRLLEAPESSVILHALDAIDTLAHHPAEGKRSAALFEMLLPAILSHGLAEAGWTVSRRALEKHPSETAWRPHAIATLRAARSHLPSLDRLIEVSGLDRLAVKPAEAFAALDRTLPYAPGFYVEHSGWGLGAIVDNDGEFLTINFPTRPGHRMNLKSAAGVLTSLPADDLKVKASIDLPGLKKMAVEDPAGLVHMALRKAGGMAGAPELRKILVPLVLATGEWSPWWKRTKDALAKDARIDSRQKFREVYRVASPGDDDDFVLPTMDEPKGIDHNVDLIYNFIEHHPTAESEMKKEFTERVRRWADRRTASGAERARARLLLSRWEADSKEIHEAAINELFSDDLDLSAAGPFAEQSAIFEIGISGPARNAAFRVGLNARNAQMRDRAFTALFAEPGPEPVRFYIRLLAEPMENIDALFLAAEKVAARPREGEERFDELLWPTVVALIDLLNATRREPITKKGLKFLDPKSGFMARIKELPPDERMESTLMARLRDWRASDRVLFPMLEAFSGAGLESVVKSVRDKRAAAHAKLFQAAPDPDDVQSGAIVMTRHTFETLSAEMTRVNLELKTTIPQIIRRARELGDLKENAEYEAAKLKQANYSKRLAQLDNQLEKVRILEDLPVEEGKAGPGTRVTVRDEESGAESSYWILGEGDHDYGADVISYRAPLGRALTGRREGDVVEYAAADGVKKLKITSVKAEIPNGPPRGGNMA